MHFLDVCEQFESGCPSKFALFFKTLLYPSYETFQSYGEFLINQCPLWFRVETRPAWTKFWTKSQLGVGGMP